MKAEKPSFKVKAGCRFVDRNTGIAYVVRIVDEKTVVYRSVDGQGEMSSCACGIRHFEAKLQNRTFEVVQ